MYHYIKSEPQLWTVGTGIPEDKTWVSESDHNSPEEAAERVRYLNGGSVSKGVNHGDNAFPGYGEEGMTLREFLASQAMSGLLANTDWTDNTPERIAEESIRCAEALIKKLRG